MCERGKEKQDRKKETRKHLVCHLEISQVDLMQSKWQGTPSEIYMYFHTHTHTPARRQARAHTHMWVHVALSRMKEANSFFIASLASQKMHIGLHRLQIPTYACIQIQTLEFVSAGFDTRQQCMRVCILYIST